MIGSSPIKMLLSDRPPQPRIGLRPPKLAFTSLVLCPTLLHDLRGYPDSDPVAEAAYRQQFAEHASSCRSAGVFRG
jgi:hypothetical protein